MHAVTRGACLAWHANHGKTCCGAGVATDDMCACSHRLVQARADARPCSQPPAVHACIGSCAHGLHGCMHARKHMHRHSTGTHTQALHTSKGAMACCGRAWVQRVSPRMHAWHTTTLIRMHAAQAVHASCIAQLAHLQLHHTGKPSRQATTQSVWHMQQQEQAPHCLSQQATDLSNKR